MIEAATIVGETFLHDGTGTQAFYTPANPRPSEDVVFSVDVTHFAGATLAGTLAIEDRDLAGEWGVPAGTFSSITATGVKTLEVTGLKEEYRAAVTFSLGSQGDFFHAYLNASAIPD